MPDIKFKLIPTVMFEAVTFHPSQLRGSFLKALEVYPEGEILGAEVGVYEGVNAMQMLIDCPRLTLHLVDDYENVTTYTGGPRQIPEFVAGVKLHAQYNLKSYNGRKVQNFKSSLEAVNDYPDEYFNYVYIDGDHEYESVKKDLYAWFPKLKYGGVIGGHDFGMVEVSSAVKEFVHENKIRNWGLDLDLPKGRSDFWIIKEENKCQTTTE